MDRAWGDQPPVWICLFYDLAWTASFASLTQNRKLRGLSDMASYAVFFTTAWWMWVSQLFYTVDFYTDDWLHLVSMCLQLVIFGALSASTQDFDITAYISHTPGSTQLEPTDYANMSPEIYRADETTFNSQKTITLSIALSRLLLLIKYLRVAACAKRTPRLNKPYPFRLLLIPASLSVSTGLFFAAFRITFDIGRTANGARTKFILWGVALLVEMVAHLVEFQMRFYEHSGLKVRSHGSIVERFVGITVVILGEGVNSIAGTLYTLQKVHGYSISDLLLAAIVVFLLAFLYFEGPAPLKPVRRRLLWALAHLPWLLCVILLLEGIKSQILDQAVTMSYDDSWGRFTKGLFASLRDNTDQPFDESELKRQLQLPLLQGGLTFASEWPKFTELLNEQGYQGYNGSNFESYLDVLGVWYQRECLLIQVSIYIDIFGGNSSIRDSTWAKINKYNSEYQRPLTDWNTSIVYPAPYLTDISIDLADVEITFGRFIMGLGGGTIVSLAILNSIQSQPRDCFQYSSILSRYAVGLIMMLLLLLNIGKYQSNFPPPGGESDQAPVFRYALVSCLTAAYAVQFLIDRILLFHSVRYSKKKLDGSVGRNPCTQSNNATSGEARQTLEGDGATEALEDNCQSNMLSEALTPPAEI
ncbi:hypothetical protein BDV93DRAFT_605436 [Ceratobasidium sp. AG-I]|nr:hypothetical protein BDV93DRAFT_605436 [Ceratobasidium sp. AG-I]